MWHLFCFKPTQILNLKYTILQLPKDTAPTQCIGWLNTPAKPERYNHSFRLVFEHKTLHSTVRTWYRIIVINTIKSKTDEKLNLDQEKDRELVSHKREEKSEKLAHCLEFSEEEQRYLKETNDRDRESRSTETESITVRPASCLNLHAM